MYKRKLCQHCETGKRTYELDSRAPMCPYLSCNNGKKCGMYKKINMPKKESVLRSFIDWLRGFLPPTRNELLTVSQSLLRVFSDRRLFCYFA